MMNSHLQVGWESRLPWDIALQGYYLPDVQ